MNETTKYAIHEESYLWGLEIGLGAALHCKTKDDIETCLKRVQCRRTRGERAEVDRRAGEDEWKSWMVELEMRSWDRAQ